MSIELDFKKVKDFLNKVLGKDYTRTTRRLSNYISDTEIIDALADEYEGSVDKELKNEFKVAGVITNWITVEDIIVPSKKRIEEKIKELESKNEKQDAELLKNLNESLLKGLQTAAVCKGTCGDLEKDIFFFSEDFINKVLDEIDKKNNTNIKDLILNTPYGELLDRQELSDPAHREALIDACSFFNFIKLHELSGHIDHGDLFSKFAKTMPDYSNILFDLRIHEINEGIIFENIFKRFKKNFPEGVFLNTFRTFPQNRLIDFAYELVKNTKSKKFSGILHGFSLKYMDILESIDEKKVEKNFDKIKHIVKELDKHFDAIGNFLNRNTFNINLPKLREIDYSEKFEYIISEIQKKFKNDEFVPVGYYRLVEAAEKAYEILPLIMREEKNRRGQGQGPTRNGGGGGGGGRITRGGGGEEPVKRIKKKFNKNLDPFKKDDEKEQERKKRTREYKASQNKTLNDLEPRIDKITRNTEMGDSVYKLSEKEIKLMLLKQIQSLLQDTMQAVKGIVQKTISKSIDGNVPDYFEAALGQISQDRVKTSNPIVIPEGMINSREKRIHFNPIFLTFFDNSGSMSIKFDDETLLGICKNAALNTLCDEGISMLSVDWDVDLANVLALNKKSKTFKEDKEKFLRMIGGGGTDNFGKFYKDLPKYVDSPEFKQMFQDELKKLELTPEDLKKKWKDGLVHVIYFTDGEFGDFAESLGDLTKIPPLNKALKKGFKPFIFVCPYKEIIQDSVKNLPEKLYKILYFNSEHLKKTKE